MEDVVNFVSIRNLGIIVNVHYQDIDYTTIVMNVLASIYKCVLLVYDI